MCVDAPGCAHAAWRGVRGAGTMETRTLFVVEWRVWTALTCLHEGPGWFPTKDPDEPSGLRTYPVTLHFGANDLSMYFYLSSTYCIILAFRTV